LVRRRMKGRRALARNWRASGAGGAVGFFGEGCEGAGSAEHAGIQEFQKAPKLAEMILHGRAGEGEAVSARRRRAALADSLEAFLIAWASSRMT